jgi:hypothetical protein
MNTKRMIWSRLLSVVATAVLVLSLGGIAIAQRGPGFGWRYNSGAGGYYSGKVAVAPEKVEAAAKAALAKAKKGTAWSSRGGVAHTPILIGTEIVGQLWEDADLSKLQVGSFWAGPFGQKVELVSGTRVVGMMWVRE